MRVSIEDLIVGNTYYIIEECYFLDIQIKNASKKYFYGIFIRKYLSRHHSYLVFNVDGYQYLLHVNSQIYSLVLDNKLLQDIKFYNKNIPKLTDLCKMKLTTSDIEYVKKCLM